MESLKAQDTPAVILLSEYARRIQDMSRTLGESFAPETETTLVLNRDNPIIQRLGSLSDENKAGFALRREQGAGLPAGL